MLFSAIIRPKALRRDKSKRAADTERVLKALEVRLIRVF
jgi:hypothetical protein